MTDSRPLRLAGKTCFITGAASGIGAATARVFANAGASVVLAWYPPDGHDVGLVEKAITGSTDYTDALFELQKDKSLDAMAITINWPGISTPPR